MFGFGSSCVKTFTEPSKLRLACRSGEFAGQTSGQASGFAQANLCILPKEYAYDFLLYCTRNPKPCPLLHVLDEGEFTFGIWGKKIDIRTDLPRYRIFKDGELLKEVTSLKDLPESLLNDLQSPPSSSSSSALASVDDLSSVDTEIDEPNPIQSVATATITTDSSNNTKLFQDSTTLWRNDFVTFVIGCSFSFEEALLRSGIPVRNIDQSKNVPMYRTNIPTDKAGLFSGPLVVSMRPMSHADSIRAVEITSRYPRVHGSPIYIGKPEVHGTFINTYSMPAIGIDNLEKPDFGEAVEIKDGEVCVFWACGVTPQLAVAAAKPSICITHAPGCMLVLDTKNDQLSS